MAVEALYLKIQRDILARENTMTGKRNQRNFLIDKIKQNKKDKELCEAFKIELKKIEEEILQLSADIERDFAEFDDIRHQLGDIRLSLTVFADLAYNELLRYESFLNKYVLNRDPLTTENVHKAIDAFKQLPFALGDTGKVNSVYDIVIEQCHENWQQLKLDMVKKATKQVDEKYFSNKKNLRLIV